jgi:hypothetical protein
VLGLSWQICLGSPKEKSISLRFLTGGKFKEWFHGQVATKQIELLRRDFQSYDPPEIVGYTGNGGCKFKEYGMKIFCMEKSQNFGQTFVGLV